jgi:hypothetical protein
MKPYSAQPGIPASIPAASTTLLNFQGNSLTRSGGRSRRKLPFSKINYDIAAMLPEQTTKKQADSFISG